MTKYKYELRRSARKSISVEITREAKLLVRAPLRMSVADIERFLNSRSAWIDSHLEKMKKLASAPSDKFTEEELEAIKKRAKAVITPKVRQFAARMGVSYNRIAFKTQKTRFGSCSSKKNLNFNALVVLLPEPIVDYVVVHELAHLREMNHSDKFWRVVGRIIPDYAARRKYLQTEGGKLIRRLP